MLGSAHSTRPVTNGPERLRQNSRLCDFLVISGFGPFIICDPSIIHGLNSPDYHKVTKALNGPETFARGPLVARPGRVRRAKLTTSS